MTVDVTPFNTPINKIFSAIRDQPWVRKPPPLPPTKRNLNSDHFCSYHQGTGHKTVQCKALLKYLEELLKQGYLEQYALSPGVGQDSGVPLKAPETSNHGRNRGDRDVPPYKVVSAIFGATPVEGYTSKDRKIYVNQARRGDSINTIVDPTSAPSTPISFSDLDAVGVHFPHNDALVITIPIGNCKVSRVLVDTGSSVNIIYGQALDQMEATPGEARALIHPQSELLYGFDGSQSTSPGIISYPVRADPYNLITNFHVLDIPSPHNFILGRPWIHRMRAVTSTYHLLIRYPTPEGTADIRCDQGISRSCSAIALKRAGWAFRAAANEEGETSRADKKRKATLEG